MVRKRSWVRFPLEAPQEVIMKESFRELYTRLYKENFNELEALRSKIKKNGVVAIIVVTAMFLFAAINPIFIVLAIIGIVIWSASTKRLKNVTDTKGTTYVDLFKQKIIGPIIENAFEAAKYNPKAGLSREDYIKGGYKDDIDRYISDDLIIAPLKVGKELSTFVTFAEVHTKKRYKDSDGDTRYSTQFHGIAGGFLIPKDIGKRIYIRSNGSVSTWNENKVKMDVPEFEKLFDVESDDKILAMRILTADVMTEMIDLYKKCKFGFEVSIVKDNVYMRISTGPMFEPDIFKSSMEYKQIEKYYLVLKALTSIASHIYDTVDKIEM